MEENRFRERFLALNEHLLISLLYFNTNVTIFRIILDMLKPMDIVSLTRATFFRSKPSKE
jgi:hypothetical protein